VEGELRGDLPRRNRGRRVFAPVAILLSACSCALISIVVDARGDGSRERKMFAPKSDAPEFRAPPAVLAGKTESLEEQANTVAPTKTRVEANRRGDMLFDIIGAVTEQSRVWRPRVEHEHRCETLKPVACFQLGELNTDNTPQYR
jgi:hypothetical protein